MSESEEKIISKKVGKNVCGTAPKVSVVIPAYNISAYIAETLDSVLAQTYKNYEIILINDGSKDTKELEAALKPYFDYIVYAQQENSGASQARNTAISLSRGELIAFLDGDDIWLPRFLESQVDFLEKNNLEMAYCDAKIFGEPLFEGRTFMQDSPSGGEVTPISLINTDCNVITSGTILKKDLLEKSGLFDVSIRRAQDFDLWFRLAKDGAKIGYSREVLIKYRVRSDNLSGTNIDRAERNIRALEIIGNKYELDELEKEVWQKQMALCEAEYELEQGKSCLVSGNYSQAQTHISEANKFYRKPKLALLVWLIRFSPKLTLQVFKKLRPAEFSFVAPPKS